ncbi:MAG TPA: ABC transporter permease [Candidatus Limnocylindrales bacterium]|nr:ABC transporter permease [Candidatus Limnocylindrales bacterium]
MAAIKELRGRTYDASVRPGPLALVAEGVQDVLSRRRLVRYLARADIKKKGANTLLGNIWWVLDPLLQMVVYVIFVEIISPRKVPDYPLFILGTILPWKWFTTAVQDSTMSVVSQERLIKQIQFPKIVLPLASMTSAVIDFAFGMIPLLGLMLLFPHRITPYLLLIPFVAVVQYVFTIAFGLVVAAGNVFFRDLANVVRHVLRLWWFLSPGLYSISQLEGAGLFRSHPLLRQLALLNPFAILFDSYRSLIYGSIDRNGVSSPPAMPDWAGLVGLLVVSFFLVGVAIAIFKRLEPNFAKVL